MCECERKSVLVCINLILHSLPISIHIKNRAWSPPFLPSFPPSLHHVFYISKIKDGQKKNIYSVQGVGGRRRVGGYRGPPYKKMEVKQNSERGRVGGRRWGGTSPPQELEVGARRAPYLLVANT